jgi:hypothetical protein
MKMFATPRLGLFRFSHSPNEAANIAKTENRNQCRLFRQYDSRRNRVFQLMGMATTTISIIMPH